MELVREHINFKRGLDPKKAMGIGENPEKWFNNLKVGDIFQLKKDIPNFNYEKGLYILVTKIEKDERPERVEVLYQHSYIFNHLKINGKDSFGIGKFWGWPFSFFENFLSKIGEIKMNESINFQRGLDPKHAMGIGLIEQWKKYIDSCENMACYDVYMKDFDKIGNEYFKSHLVEVVRIIIQTLIRIINKMPSQKAYESSCEEELKDTSDLLDRIKIKEKTAEILAQKFSIYVNPDK